MGQRLSTRLLLLKGVQVKVIDNIGRFTIAQCSKDYIVINNELEYCNHSHFRNYNGAKKCVELIRKGLLPRSRYFRIAAKRLLGDEYEDLIEYRKEKYININKGVR